jgi:hypothetical protein
VLFKDTDPTVNLARFTALHTKKDQFEQALGEEAEWDEMAGSKATRASPLGDVEDVDQWPAMIDWLYTSRASSAARHPRIQHSGHDDIPGTDVRRRVLLSAPTLSVARWSG